MLFDSRHLFAPNYMVLISTRYQIAWLTTRPLDCMDANTSLDYNAWQLDLKVALLATTVYMIFRLHGWQLNF